MATLLVVVAVIINHTVVNHRATVATVGSKATKEVVATANNSPPTATRTNSNHPTVVANNPVTLLDPMIRVAIKQPTKPSHSQHHQEAAVISHAPSSWETSAMSTTEVLKICSHKWALTPSTSEL